MLFKAQHISVSICRPPEQVYGFIAHPGNLPQWAAGLSGSVKEVGGEWISESPMGEVKVKFADANAFGVLDHHVTVPSGETFHNPMRVLANHLGSEVVFTLYRRPETTDLKYAADAEAVTRDLMKLKSLLEGPLAG